MTQTSIQYPIGKLSIPTTITPGQVSEAIEVLRVFPQQLKMTLLDVTETKLDTPYREGGWSLRQLIHHISDSHSHCYNRMRWALTEDTPLVKSYDQDLFAAMDDYKTAPIAWSLTHIEMLHHKMVYILQRINGKQWNRCYVHPQTQAEVSIKEMALTYAWHSMHHFMHIKNAL